MRFLRKTTPRGGRPASIVDGDQLRDILRGKLYRARRSYLEAITPTEMQLIAIHIESLELALGIRRVVIAEISHDDDLDEELES